MYHVIILPHFLRQLNTYVKKHRRLKDDVIVCLEQFDARLHAHLGNNVYKVRLKSRDIPRGKSKSFRLIVLLINAGSFLVPISIYFKGDQEDIARKEINDHLETILFELRARQFLM
ncbi:hypothetical protein A3I42_03625 [Candidatus Uhrbacteria bacterium RIFCSPLOWO2_02_FULL_49_11]|uniref:Addiction module toxin RelE n=1 Tax=Candidatus Uhrbacteria bacterium RIFCSPLOWO2_02_FULL_49_11 TaxID=1802409 RepID=A0A1F7VDN5_9BACT|nr:MAG: hypothetical protein A3I42_03625 [Candidatus Uhrbacteria bacterium RIFCSPLOWO2_02_FULL_49_11]